MRGATGRKFSRVRAVARFNVCSGIPIKLSIRVRTATRAASEEPTARKKSHVSHTIANVIATRWENRAFRAASSRGARRRSVARDDNTAYVASMLIRRIAEVGWETTRATKKREATARQCVARRWHVARIRRNRMNPRDCGDAWNCAHTANRAVGTDAWRAMDGSNVDRSSSKNARKVMPPTMNGYNMRKSRVGTPVAAARVQRARKAPGQFVEYAVGSSVRCPVRAKFWASAKCMYASQYRGVGSNSVGVPARVARRTTPVRATRPSDSDQTAITTATAISAIPSQ